MGHTGTALAKPPSVLMGFPHSQQLWAIRYSLGSQDSSRMVWSPSQLPPGSVPGSPRRNAAEKDSADLAFKEVGQQTDGRCWGGGTGG